MGAFCGKQDADANGEAHRPQSQSASQQQQQQQQKTEQPSHSQQQQHGHNGQTPSPPGNGISPPLEGSAAAAASSSASAAVDETDVNVAVGAAEPEFQAAEAEKQARGDEAYSFWDRNKTFKPLRAPAPAGSKQSQLQHTMQATMKATLGGGELQNTVKLPEGEDVNEWIAVNTVHFFNAASMIYGTCAQFCTDQTCPTMSAGKAEYLWKDGAAYKKPTRVSAPVYIDLLLSWADARISDPALFPVDANAKFPRNFMQEVKQIYKRLFRLYAHLYCTHSEKIRSIGANAHLNTCFKHFIYFVLEFNLMDNQEMQPLEKLIAKLRAKR